MLVLPEDMERYRLFIEDQIKLLRSLEIDAEKVLWHYTSGQGLLGIIESGALFATQVSCLNDSTEVRYASQLFRDALLWVRQRHVADAGISEFLEGITSALLEDPSRPSHAPNMYFVTCFTDQADDLSQWRAYCGDENGYAIGFRAQGLFGNPNSLVAHVNYSPEQHKAVAEQVAEATVRFFTDGIESGRAASPQEWAAEFIPVWTNWIGRLAPLVKNEAFQAENEYRVVHQLQANEMGQIRFRQKRTLMSRHLPLVFPQTAAPRFPMLPIVGVKIGPTRHKEITRISVDTLMKQMGYGSGNVSNSDIPYQVT
jgi:hypothetical protein